jgi:hypothetical protein
VTVDEHTTRFVLSDRVSGITSGLRGKVNAELVAIEEDLWSPPAPTLAVDSLLHLLGIARALNGYLADGLLQTQQVVRGEDDLGRTNVLLEAG